MNRTKGETQHTVIGAKAAVKLEKALFTCNTCYMKTERKKLRTMTEALRQAIADSGLAFIEIERQTGVLRQTLMKFSRNEQSLRLDMADKLAEFFGLELVERKGK